VARVGANLDLERAQSLGVVGMRDVTDVRVLGGVDVLVNNAIAPVPRSHPEDLELERWEHSLRVNLTGYFLCAQVFGRQMRALGRGSLIHVSSIAGSHAQGHSGAYSVSKAGVIMLSQQLANEWGPHGIRSNVVSPGMVITPMSQAFYDTPGVTERRSAVVPMRRVGMPQDMADAILFLASDRASYVNGDEIMVDGGYANMLMNLVPRPGFELKGGPSMSGKGKADEGSRVLFDFRF
jgi:NAD(P)-dependent dehydrogenase (short-subunit alcohol dehydrogenase family)